MNISRPEMAPANKSKLLIGLFAVAAISALFDDFETFGNVTDYTGSGALGLAFLSYFGVRKQSA